ncbi:B12-binding domain-containing radical SAM protein [candidate division KSB1 bacterium]
MDLSKKIDVLLAYPSEKMMLHSSMMPLGLASIAAVLEREKYKVRIIDFNFYKGEFIKELQELNPSVVGIGGTTPTRKGSFEIARMVKKALPGVPVIYGGVHATFAAEDTLKNVSSIDYILKGEGEFTFLELCDILIRKKEVKIGAIPGICFRRDENIFCSKPDRIEDLSILPQPARHLFKNDYSFELDFFKVKTEMIITSRGCPAKCTFCSASQMFPGGVRTRPIDSIEKEIKMLIDSKGIKGLKIFDSTFTADRKQVIDFCRMIKPYHLMWECEIRADTVDFGLLKTMKEAGCCYLNIGLETTNKNLIKSINKQIDLTQVENILHWCQTLEIKTKIFFIFGLFDETFKDCMADIKWLKKHKNLIDLYSTSIGMKIYPGTILEKQAKSRMLIKEDFSWFKFKPPMKNLLIGEFNDVPVLFQKQLNAVKLAVVSILLFLQGTALTPRYILILFKKVVSITFVRILEMTGLFRKSKY